MAKSNKKVEKYSPPPNSVLVTTLKSAAKIKSKKHIISLISETVHEANKRRAGQEKMAASAAIDSHLGY